MDNLIDTISDNSILVIPNNIKDEILLHIREKRRNTNIKIFSLEEFIKNLTFDYDERTKDYLMKKNNINYNISNLYLQNIKYINDDSNNNKIHNLFLIKKDVNNYLIINNLFKKLINNKNIYVYGYDYINKYQISILKNINNLVIINKEYKDYNHTVYSFNKLDDEVIYVAEEVSKLINDGIDINNIYVSNLDDDYRLVFKRIFAMYDIPINLDIKTSIYETSIGKYFINNLSNDIELLLNNLKEVFNLDNNNNYSIYKKIINVINMFYFTTDYISVKDNIVEVMKKTYISSKKYKYAINEINIINNIVDDEKYVFLVGFNLNKFPKTIKDEDYLSDDIKPDVLEKTYEINLINKDIYYKAISNIKNLFISYKDKYLNESFYPSLLIDEYNMKVSLYDLRYSCYSEDINKLFLATDLDKLIKFNEKSDRLNILYSNYEINYNSYDNSFGGINKDNLYKYLNKKLTLSYSSMDNYYHCAFKYYLSNILKIDKYESNIQAYIGNLFHYVLSKAFNNDFDFNTCVNYYLNNNEYENNHKNNYFINKTLEELKLVINNIKHQNSVSNMNETFYEKQVFVEKNGILNTTFKGFIDKLLKKDNYIVIIDYKTYTLDIKLNYLPYGLSMQLPVYLYLTKNIDMNYKIIGFYLQQVLFNKFNKDKDKKLEELIKNNLKLKGYSLGNESILSQFDNTLIDSEIIHGMKLTDKGFGYYSKVLTEKQIDNIYTITDNKINECIKNIENAIFTINPKMINNKNIGCEYCKFKDICYVKNKDIVVLEDIKDLNFLD